MTVNGRTDDGSDESIVSLKFEEHTVLKCIGGMTKIDSVTLQVALMDPSDAQSFTTYRAWKPPRKVLKLYTGTIALVNLTFLVDDDGLTAEDRLIGLPVLQHLGINSSTLLEQKQDFLDGID